ncbi:MAG: chemoreceptor glutamine deamidase CheD [Proteobacteria bacterium]|nr:chemoreceptor glutamine deamidase CheD [Burkholderiales bacterium]
MSETAQQGIAENLYFDRTFETEAAKLLPGEYFVTDRDMVLVTVLGSCVSACIRDPQTRVGGMNHFMLPDGNHADGVLNESARYGAYAMEVLINAIMKQGARRTHLEAKLFGGGNVLEGLTVANVGPRNAAFARAFLKTEGIPILAEDLEDIYPRKLYYFPRTGRVMVKKLKTAQTRVVVDREREYRQRLVQQPAAGVVELF